jgi:hypothetical protein
MSKTYVLMPLPKTCSGARCDGTLSTQEKESGRSFDQEFKTSLGNIARHHRKTERENKNLVWS